MGPPGTFDLGDSSGSDDEVEQEQFLPPSLDLNKSEDLVARLVPRLPGQMSDELIKHLNILAPGSTRCGNLSGFNQFLEDATGLVGGAARPPGLTVSLVAGLPRWLQLCPSALACLGAPPCPPAENGGRGGGHV